MMLEAERRRAREAQHHRLASRRVEPVLGRLAHDLGTIAVSEDQPGVFRDGIQVWP